MKEVNSIKKNYFYNLISEIVLIAVPLITMPYVSRVLHEDGIGKYSFSYSIVYYFFLFSALGYGYYARREIAKARDDNYKCSIVFWEINISRAFTTLISIVSLFIVLLAGAFEEYKLIMIACSVIIVDNMFNLNYFFQGREEFKSLSIKNVLCKLAGMVLIFVFVRNENDVWLYALFLSGSTFIGDFLMWPLAFKKICKVKIREIHFYKHFIPCFKLFLPTIAVALYQVIDKTLIGFLVSGTYEENKIIVKDGIEIVTSEVKKLSDYENGCYEQAYRAISILVTVVTLLGPILLPKNTNAYSKGNMKLVKDNIYKSIKYVWIIGIILVVSTIGLSKNISTVLFGDGYDKVPLIMMILSGAVIFMGLSNTFGVQYLLATHRDKEYTFCIITGGLFNIILNFIFIPFFGAVGAAVGTLIAEFIILTLEVLLTIRLQEISILESLKYSVKSCIAGIIVLFLLYFLQNEYFGYSITSFIILGTIGVSSYFIILIAFNEKTVISFLYDSFHKIKKKIQKGRV